MESKQTWRDWPDLITTEELTDNMSKRRIEVACYYKDGERRRIYWHPLKGELVVWVNGAKTIFEDDIAGRDKACELFKRGLNSVTTNNNL